MPRRRRLVYWDACVWVAHIGQHKLEPGLREGIRASVQEIEDGKAQLVVSDVMKAEILQAKMSKEQQKKYASLLNNRKYVVKVDADAKVMELAQEIRSYYARRGKGRSGRIDTVDSIHLATAILYGAEEFYTFDRGEKSKSKDLLTLGKSVAGHKLSVCKPPFDQYDLPLDT